eukprot:COSAG01_NODE_1114_length_11650_cov_28.837590_7_plen_187_part_00
MSRLFLSRNIEVSTRTEAHPAWMGRGGGGATGCCCWWMDGALMGSLMPTAGARGALDQAPDQGVLGARAGVAAVVRGGDGAAGGARGGRQLLIRAAGAPRRGRTGRRWRRRLGVSEGGNEGASEGGNEGGREGGREGGMEDTERRCARSRWDPRRRPARVWALQVIITVYDDPTAAAAAAVATIAL